MKSSSISSTPINLPIVSPIVNASHATWYNYIYKLGWERPKPSKKSKYGILIRANRSYQVWHTDITIVKCLKGMKYYIYLLMDNFSRFILNYQVSEKVSAVIRKESIQKAFELNIQKPDEDVQLIVDGGVENNNNAVYPNIWIIWPKTP